MREIFLGMLGLCMGTTIASGVVAFIISLGIVPRFAGITGSAAQVDEIIMLGKVLAHEVEENSENWDYDLVQEAKSITRKINNRCM